jgi:hypothetical protein
VRGVRSPLVRCALFLACASCSDAEPPPSAAEIVYGGHNAATMRGADKGLVDRPPRGVAVPRDWKTQDQAPLSQSQIDELTAELLDPAFIASLETTDAPVVSGKTLLLSSYDSNGVLVLVDADAPLIEFIDSGGEPGDLRFRVGAAGSKTLARLRDR